MSVFQKKKHYSKKRKFNFFYKDQGRHKSFHFFLQFKYQLEGIEQVQIGPSRSTLLILAFLVSGEKFEGGENWYNDCSEGKIVSKSRVE